MENEINHHVRVTADITFWLFRSTTGGIIRDGRPGGTFGESNEGFSRGIEGVVASGVSGVGDGAVGDNGSGTEAAGMGIKVEGSNVPGLGSSPLRSASFLATFSGGGKSQGRGTCRCSVLFESAESCTVTSAAGMILKLR